MARGLREPASGGLAPVKRVDQQTLTEIHLKLLRMCVNGGYRCRTVVEGKESPDGMASFKEMRVLEDNGYCQHIRWNKNESGTVEHLFFATDNGRESVKRLAND